MDIIENIKQTLLNKPLEEVVEEFYFVPERLICILHTEVQTYYYGAMIQEEDSWDGSDLNLQISI